ncbi:HNH endonuclease [Fulvimarina sp. MAC3]|uniref:HNH endonuclease n=1 Tax=Fulvimarina sp. MAC3 TaxID=3148887 RepID=UPI0031FD7D09
MRRTSLLWDTEGKRNRLYGRRWRTARAAFLSEHPLCTMCAKAGRTEPATVVDHVVPHKGDEALFWDRSNWQTLCEHHHNSEKAKIEIRGYSDRIGDDGWPVDPSHPALSGETMISGKSKPDGLKRLNVPSVIVCGPPAAGKSRYCQDNANPDDLIIDFDGIDAEINGRARMRNRLIVPILRERNRRIIEAAKRTIGRVWLPMTLPLVADRQWWRSAIGAETVVIEADSELCKSRILADAERSSTAREQCDAVDAWWRAYRHDPSETRLKAPWGGVEDGESDPGHRRPHTNAYLVLKSEGPEDGA